MTMKIIVEFAKALETVIDEMRDEISYIHKKLDLVQSSVDDLQKQCDDIKYYAHSTWHRDKIIPEVERRID